MAARMPPMLVDAPSISVITRSKAVKLKFFSPSSWLVNLCFFRISSMTEGLDVYFEPPSALDRPRDYALASAAFLAAAGGCPFFPGAAAANFSSSWRLRSSSASSSFFWRRTSSLRNFSSSLCEKVFGQRATFSTPCSG
jgi:hypothetical protein